MAASWSQRLNDAFYKKRGDLKLEAADASEPDIMLGKGVQIEVWGVS